MNRAAQTSFGIEVYFRSYACTLGGAGVCSCPRAARGVHKVERLPDIPLDAEKLHPWFFTESWLRAVVQPQPPRPGDYHVKLPAWFLSRYVHPEAITLTLRD